jgi:hypothetical protein
MSRTRAAAYAVTVAGSVLVLIAMWLGFSDVQVGWTGDASLSCGNIFGPQTKLDPSLVSEFQQQCAQARSRRQSGFWETMVVGLVALGAGGFLLLISIQQQQKRGNR